MVKKETLNESLSKHQNIRRLESIAGGPLQLNEDGTFDLTVINSYLNEHKLELEIVYFANENRYGFSIYRKSTPLTEEVKKFSDEGDFHSVKNLTVESKTKYKHPVKELTLNPKSKSKLKSEDDYKVR